MQPASHSDCLDIFFKKISASNQISWRWFQGDRIFSLSLADYYSILFVCQSISVSFSWQTANSNASPLSKVVVLVN
jgi:hypothetical protein